jgi:hypothetical protein
LKEHAWKSIPPRVLEVVGDPCSGSNQSLVTKTPEARPAVYRNRRSIRATWARACCGCEAHALHYRTRELELTTESRARSACVI